MDENVLAVLREHISYLQERDAKREETLDKLQKENSELRLALGQAVVYYNALYTAWDNSCQWESDRDMEAHWRMLLEQ